MTPKILFINQGKPQIINEINSDILSAFDSLDCTVEVIEIDPVIDARKNGDLELARQLQQNIVQTIKEFCPDMALGYGFRGIMQVAENDHLLNVLGIPYAALFFDNPLYNKNQIQHCKNKDNIYIFCHDRAFFTPLNELGFENCIYFPIATSMHKYLKPENQIELNSNQLMFIGGVSRPEEFEEWLEPFDSDQKLFADFATKEIMLNGERRQLAVVLKFHTEYPHLKEKFQVNDLDFQSLWFVIDKALTSQLRIKTVASVADFGINVYGRFEGWKTAFENTPGVKLMPFAHYREQLPWIYRSTPIVINSSPLNLQNAIQQRILDVGAVGGFILTEYQPVLEDIFEIGKEIDVYYDLDDLKKKVEFYLNEPDKRKAMAEQLNKNILANHTWQKRLEQFLKMITEDYKVAAETVLNEFISTPHSQGLIILLGAQNPLLRSALKEILEEDQRLLIVDFQQQNISEITENITVSCGESIPEFKSKLISTLALTYDLRFKICQEISNDQQRTNSLNAMRAHIVPMVQQELFKESYFRESAELEMFNTLLNVPLMKTQNGIGSLRAIAPAGSVAVVVGAGPSLSGQLEWLGKNRKKVFIISAGSALRAMESAGIEPDIYVEIDIRSFEHWEEDKFYNSNLVCSPNISPGFAACFKQVYWFSFNTWFDNYLTNICPNISPLNATFNTGCISSALAAYMGFNRVVFLGIDLCMSPEGASHTEFHNQGKDLLIHNAGDERYDTVKNNLGEDCLTLFGKIGMIEGFENVISQNPATSFIQASPKGVKLNGAEYTHWLELDVSNPIKAIIPDDRCSTVEILPELRKTISRIISQTETMTPQDEYTHLLSKTALWNSVFREHLPYGKIQENLFEFELNRLQEKVVGNLDDVLQISEKVFNSKEPYRELYKLYKDSYMTNGVECDWNAELSLLKQRSPISGEKVAHTIYSENNNHKNNFRVASRGKNKIQLQVYDKERERYVLSVGYYDWLEAAKLLINEHLNLWQSLGVKVETIICVGLYDANYLNILRRYFPHKHVIFIEPYHNLFAEVLRYIPVVSTLGDNTTYLIDETDETIDRTVSSLEHTTTGIICPDLNSNHFTKWNDIYQSIINRYPLPRKKKQI